MMICDHWVMRRRVERVGRHQAALGGQISLGALRAYYEYTGGGGLFVVGA